MDLLHLHTMLVHFPVVGPLFVIVVLLLAAWRNSKELLLTALGLALGVALLSGFAYLAGEAAEDLAENIPGTSEALIEHHEELAKFALLALAFAGTLSLAALWPTLRGQSLRAISLALLAVHLLVLPVIAIAANAGGQIRHSNLRGAVPVEIDDD